MLACNLVPLRMARPYYNFLVALWTLYPETSKVRALWCRFCSKMCNAPELQQNTLAAVPPSALEVCFISAKNEVFRAPSAGEGSPLSSPRGAQQPGGPGLGFLPLPPVSPLHLNKRKDNGDGAYIFHQFLTRSVPLPTTKSIFPVSRAVT